MQLNAVQHQRGHRSATIISFLEREGGSHDCFKVRVEFFLFLQLNSY
jgi:hypothetical protein